MTAKGIWTFGPAAIAANGNSGPISLGALDDWQNFWFSLVTGTPTGTTPTLAVTISPVDPFGNVIGNLVSLPAGFSLTTVAGSAQASFGVNNPTATLCACPPAAVQVSWAVTGTTPNYPNVQMSLFGR